MKLHLPDVELLKNRGYDQKWKQIVRNLVSHRTLEKQGIAYYDKTTGYYIAAPYGYTLADRLLRENG